MIGRRLHLPFASPFFVGRERDFVLDFSQRLVAEGRWANHGRTLFGQFIGSFIAGMSLMGRDPDEGDPSPQIYDSVECPDYIKNCLALNLGAVQGPYGCL